MTSKRTPTRRTPEADLRWKVTCTQCAPSYLSRATTETTARAHADAHALHRPGHTATATPVDTPMEET